MTDHDVTDPRTTSQVRRQDPVYFHDPAYFRAMYADGEDPWGFDRRWYERRKYALTMAALPRERYRRAFEPGCANGALTELLARRCDEVIAAELLDDVARRAHARHAGSPHVSVHCAPFPHWWPDGTIDLLVLSEIAYYLTAEGRRVAEAAVRRSLEPGADVVAVHYTGPTDYPMPGTAVAHWLDGVDGLNRVVTHVDASIDEAGFELGVWRFTPEQLRP
jgi:hypothetical protein